jgi:hypothetical protein
LIKFVDATGRSGWSVRTTSSIDPVELRDALCDHIDALTLTMATAHFDDVPTVVAPVHRSRPRRRHG